MSTAESNADIQILYVEDDPASGRLVQSIAETAGYEVDVVTTGSEFLSSLTTHKPDLLLVDLHLPDASGLELLAKARLRLPESPVIVVTASNAIEDAVKALTGQVKFEEILLPHFAAAVGTRHYGEVHRAFQTNRDVTEFGERLEVASRPAAKIEDFERRFIPNVCGGHSFSPVKKV